MGSNDEPPSLREIEMAENKPGETIKIAYEQIDSDGKRIANISCEWFGFDNADANAASMQLVQAVFTTADGWREAKAGKGSTRAPGR